MLPHALAAHHLPYLCLPLLVLPVVDHCSVPLHPLFLPCWFKLVFLWHCSDCSLLGTWHADVCGFSGTSFHLVFSLHMSVVSWSHLLLLLVATCYSLACMLHHLSPILTRVLLLYHDTTFEWSAFALVCAALPLRG